MLSIINLFWLSIFLRTKYVYGFFLYIYGKTVTAYKLPVTVKRERRIYFQGKAAAPEKFHAFKCEKLSLKKFCKKIRQLETVDFSDKNKVDFTVVCYTVRRYGKTAAAVFTVGNGRHDTAYRLFFPSVHGKCIIAVLKVRRVTISDM